MQGSAGEETRWREKHKRDRNGVDGLLGQASQDFIGCPQC